MIDEAKAITQMPNFKGYIHDVGGPTANFRRAACDKQLKVGTCVGRQCLFPKPCPNMVVDHTDYIKLLREVRALPKVKKVFVRSGLRYDYIMADKSDAFLRELCQYHVSGQLKVARSTSARRCSPSWASRDAMSTMRFVKNINESIRNSARNSTSFPI